MATVTAVKTTTGKAVGMGQVALGQGPARLTAVLGSCIGLALHHARLKVGVLVHVVLPTSTGHAAKPGKFADTAVPHALTLMKGRGAAATGLTAKIVGGASMFGSGGPLRIGEENAEAVLKALEAAGVRVAARDLGGNGGRRIALDCNTGQLTVEKVGSPPKTL